MSQQSPISEDVRDELAELALATERRNRSRGLIALGAVALLAAGAAVAWAWTQREAAARELRREQARLEQVRGIERGFEALEQRRATGRLAVQQPMTNMLGLIKQAANESGLNLPETPNEESPTREGGVTERRLRYSTRSESVEPLIRWLDRAPELVPGLMVWSVRLRPVGSGWTLDVTFLRWERQS